MMATTLLAIAAVSPAWSLFAGKPWMWSLIGALGGAILAGSIITIATVLWARGVRKVWNAPELSESFLRRLIALPKRFANWIRGRGGGGIEASGLDQIWNKFAAQLPPGIREQLLDIPTVILFGGQRAGKTTLIDSHIDWPSMQGQFMPSLRDETLPLRISLGSRVLVQELAASVLESDAPATATALNDLWRPLSQVQKPLVIMAIDINRLSPERMRDPSSAAALVNEARMLVGKMALLSRMTNSQIKVRICLTHMDNVPGFASLERFCTSQHLPLRVAMHAAHSRNGGTADLLTVYRRYLPLALLRCKPEDYAGVVRFLHEMPQRLQALEPYFEELVRDPTRRLTPTLDRLYFYSNQNPRPGENPFIRAGGPERRRIRGIRAWFTRLLHGRRHLLIASAIGLAILTFLWVGFSVDGGRVDKIDKQLYKLSHAIKRTIGSHNPPYASTELHTLLSEAGHQLHDLEKYDARSILYRSLRQKRKREAQELFVQAVRESQLLPLLDRFKNRQRDDLVLFTLAVLNSTATNSLGTLMMAHLGDTARQLELPPYIVADVIHFAEKPYEERGYVVGLFSHGAGLLSGLDNPHNWYEQLVGLEKYFAARSLEPSAIAHLREDLKPYLQVVEGVGKDPLVGQIYRMLSEVAPWSVTDIQGARGFSLAPPAWLADQITAFRGLLHLVAGGNDDRNAAPQNLYQALRLLVDADGSKGIPDEVFTIDLEGRQFNFSARQWLEILRRSRKGQVVNTLFGKGERSDKPEKGTRRRRRRSSHKSETQVSYPSDSPKPAKGEDVKSEELRRDIVPILRDLDHKLDQNSTLSPDQRKALSKFVAQESRRYANEYCDALRNQYNRFAMNGGARVETTLAALRGFVQKDGPLPAHLKQLAADANVGQLEGNYLEPLRQCLEVFKPLVKLATPDKDGNLPELKPYGELVGDLIKQLEGPPPKVAEDGSKVELKDALPQAGRVTLSVMQAQPDNLQQRFSRFMQERQIVENLQGPLMSPLRHVMSMGEADMRRTLARLWEQGPRQQLTSLFDLYPFRRDAARDATTAELDALLPEKGTFWAAWNPIFLPVCVRQGGHWKARPLQGGTAALPPDLLPLVNRAEDVSHVLFAADGSHKGLTLNAKASPPQGVPDGMLAVRSFLIAGKAGKSVFMPNGVTAPQVLHIDWAQPAVAEVGVELQVGTGAPQTASTDGPESPWSLFRLLDRAQLDGKSATWKLASGSAFPTGTQLELTFSFNVEPFSLFQASRGSD